MDCNMDISSTTRHSRNIPANNNQHNPQIPWQPLQPSQEEGYMEEVSYKQQDDLFASPAMTQIREKVCTCHTTKRTPGVQYAYN